VIPWVWASLFGPGRGSRPELWLPPGSLAELRPILARLGNEDMLERAFDVAEYQPAAAFVAAGLEVTALPVVHYDIDAYGFRVVGERTLGYSGDSGPCGALEELAGDADLFLCEATLARGDLEGPLRGHLDPSEAVAAAAGAKRLVLTHRPQELDRPEGELAYDGLALEL
jgi:ribonuclease BN (tRNA processing enzyme)